ncbi:hypothetical protein [Acidovorax sp. CCYZU-2555]|uniref:hypothetical protein n=1 Tax=Acidovorax sp. CCYZU-2555 TaxID=2835042 RepID=UPI001BD12577|nr:hypothetical protein [Acidovorax sp. CCYZU-2555]MBS7777654.1 hypothetical protein [Acidovorax sp. CCYZU-2555]
MSSPNTFQTTAKSLAKNPLGIIALFIVLIYGFAALTLGFNSRLEATERIPLVYFLVSFPVVVLLLFGWLVSCHHEKLYAPSDFRSDEIFLNRASASNLHVEALRADGAELEKKILESVTNLLNTSTPPKEIAEQVAKEVQEATTFTVDAADFLGRPDAVYTYPIAAFDTISDLTNHIYFQLTPKVRPFQYGSLWVIRNKATNEILRTVRMLIGGSPGKPISDIRSLKEAGVFPGSTWVVEAPQ